MNGEIGFNADGAIVTVTLSNPDKLNAIDSTMWRALREAFVRVAAGHSLRRIIVRDAGDKAFAAGGDIEEFATARASVEDALHYHGELLAAFFDKRAPRFTGR